MLTPVPDLVERRDAFRRLHANGCFVIPNPWDPGSAQYLASLGFQALATTSAGFAFSQALPDTQAALPRDLVLRHVSEVVRATGLPVNADYQSGYAATPEGVAESVRLCVETGVAGLSIEDATGDPARPLYDLPEALERLHAARDAIDASRTGVLLTARAECYLVGHPDAFRESIRRLIAYAQAGADVLFAPGVRAPEEIQEIVTAVRPRPINLLVSADGDMSVADLAALGVRRISVGSALARAAWAGLMRAARPLAEQGSFSGLHGAANFGELNALFK